LIALAAPDELRRMALGGEVIEIQTAQAFDGSRLEDVPGVRAVRQSRPRGFLVISDDAGAATPRVLQELNTLGIQVTSSSEYRPSFDEVFSALVSRSEDDDGQMEGEAREGDRRTVSRAA